MKLPIYMDSHATTPVDGRVLEAMLPYFTDVFGNAASRTHSYGQQAEEAVDRAREQIADLIGAADTREIVFTSGATESDNLALRGVAETYRERGNHIITTVIEHKAVLDTAHVLERQGTRVTYLPVDSEGRIRLADLEAAIEDGTILISVMAANNEIGVLQPLEAIGQIARSRGILFHSDATQAVGRVPLDVDPCNIDLLSLSAHKMYGPKGVGALYVRRRSPRVRLSPIIHGGGHERGMRSGTLNVPGIVGFGKACEVAASVLPEEMERLRGLRERLKQGIMKGIDEVALNGHPEERLPGSLNLSFAYVEGESLLLKIAQDVALSTGSACTSATLEPSYVLKAMGMSDDRANGSVRFGLGRFNTEAEVDYVAERVIWATRRLRDMSPLYATAHKVELENRPSG